MRVLASRVAQRKRRRAAWLTKCKSASDELDRQGKRHAGGWDGAFNPGFALRSCVNPSCIDSSTAGRSVPTAGVSQVADDRSLTVSSWIQVHRSVWAFPLGGERLQWKDPLLGGGWVSSA